MVTAVMWLRASVCRHCARGRLPFWITNTSGNAPTLSATLFSSASIKHERNHEIVLLTQPPAHYSTELWGRVWPRSAWLLNISTASLRTSLSLFSVDLFHCNLINSSTNAVNAKSTLPLLCSAPSGQTQHPHIIILFLFFLKKQKCSDKQSRFLFLCRRKITLASQHCPTKFTGSQWKKDLTSPSWWQVRGGRRSSPLQFPICFHASQIV